MAGASDPDAFGAAVSPWRRILPHFDWLAGRPETDGLFGGLREFVALACEAPALAGRFVFPSTINMSVFRTPGPVDYLADPMPERFIVSPHGRAEVRLRYFPAGARELAREWVAPPGEAVATIAAEFSTVGG